MLTIIAIAGAAIAAVATYNRRSNEPSTQSKVVAIRQSVSVVTAVADAIWAVLDALIFLTRRSGGGNTGGSSLRPAPVFGRTTADDVATA